MNHITPNPTTVWQIPSNEVECHEHPTSKPTRCFSIPMEMCTRRGEICYEPFSGSGSQIIAGERYGRLVFGIEMEPAYCDVIVRRWEAFTGREATLDGDGRTFAAISAERGAP
jgi:DNA modification methylase